MIAANGSDTVVLAPTVYGGTVYRYTNSNGAWALQKLQGKPANRPAFISVTQRKFEADLNYRRSAIVLSSPSGIHYAKILTWSLGIVLLSTGDIVNFTAQTPLGETEELGAEMFSADGSLLGYGPLNYEDPVLDASLKTTATISILWSDDADRLNIRRQNESGFYVLSVAELVVGTQ